MNRKLIALALAVTLDPAGAVLAHDATTNDSTNQSTGDQPAVGPAGNVTGTDDVTDDPDDERDWSQAAHGLCNAYENNANGCAHGNAGGDG